MTKVLVPNDSRGISGELDKAIAEETTGILRKEAFSVVVRQENEDNARLLGTSVF